ncbi:MAG: methyltransferase [Clostridia bacterium]|nr:methyltransferase [Clostridia bacterium]
MTEIFDGERIDEVNDKIKLIQKSDGLTFGTDALLLAGYIGGRAKLGLELGAGSGIISFLLLTREKLASATALEVQKSYAELTRRNAELNSLSSRVDILNIDLRDFKSGEVYDIVYTNPPYMTVTGGAENAVTAKNLARHEVMGNIEDFCKCAASSLKYGGKFAVVYRPDRLTALLAAMGKYKLEAKRITFVHADTDSESSMVLIEAKRGGKCDAKLTAPLIIYKDALHKEYTPDMDYIMEHGSFPDKFYKK